MKVSYSSQKISHPSTTISHKVEQANSGYHVKVSGKCITLPVKQDFPGGSDAKASVYSAGDLDLIPGSGRAPGLGNGNPLQYYCLENPIDRGAWKATIHGVAKSRTRLSDFTFTFTHSSIPTWRIPWI